MKALSFYQKIGCQQISTQNALKRNISRTYEAHLFANFSLSKQPHQ